MLNTLFTLIRDAGRFALYSLVFGPALAMYVFVMLAASDGSLSRQFLTTFHDLTAGVPAGKVLSCVNDMAPVIRQTPQEPGVNTQPQLPVSPTEVLCQKGPVDSEIWARSADASLWNFWSIGVMFGCGVWFVSRRRAFAAQKRISPDTHSVLVLQNKEKHE